MEVVLVMFKADGERRNFPLHRDITVIGRREDCDLRIPLTEVSRKHCRLIKRGDQLRLEDLGSSNGTYHNGARVQEAALQPGDQVQVGPVLFTLQIDGFPADSEIHPPTPESIVNASPSGSDNGNSSSGAARTGMFAGRPLTPEDAAPQVSSSENAGNTDDNIDDLFEPSPDKDNA